ncbi:DUF2599 domain-containing protein [Listeria booriae]|uniref:DUF2599 domain-containing protein n=1 Tax=Listeria booriae TaxID=1552123 RepID=UPI001C89E789|nr:DUF2599 domain-containing protein [Listeria booriae]MCD2206417.1 DUF2599 domain-containing protein [Listeria booriae]
MRTIKNTQMTLIKILCCIAILCFSFVPFFNATVEAKAINSHTYNDYFKKVTWIKRSGVWSLSIEPKATLTKNYGNANVQGAHASRSYKLLENKHKKDKYWKNNESMANQYLCHVQFAGSMKSPWNLEPSRKKYSYSYTVKKKCNP